MRSLLDQGGAGKVQTIVTSPPYWNLRDYGVAGQLGLEATPAEFVAVMVEVFALVRELLADDGVLWLNLGDSYNAAGRTGHGTRQGFKQGTNRASAEKADNCRPSVATLKPKDLIGIPWRVAFALQADGWYLRQDIIWHKPNPMPESVTDRCTKAHEYLFLLSKRERYYWNAEAMKEPATGTDDRPQQRRAKEIAASAGLTADHMAAIRACGATDSGKARTTQDGCGKNRNHVQVLADEAKAALGGYYREFLMAEDRNRRSVWTVPTVPYSGAHFATFPPALIEPCILAGSRPGDIVFDPFMGSGTVAQVAQRLGRKWVGSELNPDYIGLQAGRTRQAGLEFAA